MSKVIQYAKLPFEMAALLTEDVYLTSLNTFLPLYQERMHKQFLEKVEVQEGNPRLDFIKGAFRDYRFVREDEILSHGVCKAGGHTYIKKNALYIFFEVNL